MAKPKLLLATLIATVAAGLACVGVRVTRAGDRPVPGLKPLLRRPVALALAGDGAQLFAANQRGGSISVVNIMTGQASAELGVGGRLSDLVATPDGTRLLAVDEERGELVVLGRGDGEPKPERRVKVSPTPVAVQVSADGKHAAVTSLWARQLSLVDLVPAPRVVRTIDLPFAPRKLLWAPGDKKVIVADSFGGGIAVVDATSGKVESVRSLPASNIRGLALSADGKRLLVSHQVINSLAQTSRDDIHWGNLLTNNVSVLSLAAVLDPKAEVLRGSEQYHLGDIGHGTGDPAGITIDTDGRVVVALAGVGEVAVGNDRGADWKYVTVGAGPTVVLPSRDGRRVYVANTFGDSVSVVDVKTGAVTVTISLGPQPELKPSDRGEVLFHDARLSNEGWLSCQSCHTDGHSNGRLADTLGDGTYGTPKRVPSLLGVKDTAPLAWNGSVPDLPAQIRKSVETTMRGHKLSAEQVRDLTAYLETLSPPPSRARLVGKLDETAVRRGQEAFGQQGCATCHAPPTYTSAKTYDVGLSDEAGLKMFNPPSLRGVGQGGPYFHDGRAKTLREVFTRHRHQVKGELTKQELADLLEFLRSL
jgi:YVTN family beta-propeller protein